MVTACTNWLVNIHNPHCTCALYLRVCPTVITCTNKINWLFFIMQTDCAVCEVGTCYLYEGCPISKVPSVTYVVSTTLDAASLLHRSVLMLQQNAEFAISVKVEIRVLYSQPFTKSHLHFLIVVECDKMAEKHLCARECVEKQRSVLWNNWAALNVLMAFLFNFRLSSKSEFRENRCASGSTWL